MDGSTNDPAMPVMAKAGGIMVVSELR
jgi:hypothetical protein